MVYGLGIFTENLFATSMTADPPDRIDLPMVWRPMRALFWVTLLPSLAYPIAALHAVGVIRAAATFHLPVSTNVPKYEDKLSPEYVVYKRTYNASTKKIEETHILSESLELASALKICGNRRGEFVEDGAGQGTSYFVMERQTINKAYLFRREKWAWATLSDLTRFVLPCLICWMFFPAARRFNTDIEIGRGAGRGRG